MVAPIPKTLLIHTVEYSAPSDGSWGSGDNSPMTIEYVRVEPKSDITNTGTGVVQVSSTLLFWDTVNSTPVDLQEEGTVIFNGYEYTIDKINEHYDESKLHHLEVILS